MAGHHQKLGQTQGMDSSLEPWREYGPADTWISDFRPLCTISVSPTPQQGGQESQGHKGQTTPTPRRVPVSPRLVAFSPEGDSCLLPRPQSTWQGMGLFVFFAH